MDLFLLSYVYVLFYVIRVFFVLFWCDVSRNGLLLFVLRVISVFFCCLICVFFLYGIILRVAFGAVNPEGRSQITLKDYGYYFSYYKQE